ncbi:type VII secretion-associated serine protease mycosin [Streptomyces sp. AcE210]|uniref:type VII secretion-associated serine protease mycosin n=1 Tax=Streptomyces sp. AcE210 TaxID=2292703 RepID=UPI000E301ECF|nr:type VII secretion-associated serine protease mycosin [Streptomyces sp. AcE210]RFC74040.1 type VII secretion-associated serine protease mycosin [Streptomyces sp. AcE210]
MPTSTSRYGRRTVSSAALGLLLVGVAATPALAESTRSKQWFLDAMQAESMWKTSTGKGITVAVIDTGVDPNNPDLNGRVLKGKDFAPSSRAGDEHTDYNGHGTGMAGLIAGTGAYSGGNGAFGLAPDAKILPVRMPGPGDISPFEVNARLSQAVRYAADAGAQVINISLTAGNDSQQVTSAVKYALGKGSLIFAGVGNSGDKGNPVQYPAATPGVVGVGAVGKDLHKTEFSEYGQQVDISAPGDEMVHACGGKTGLCESHGTSDATAIASASAALIWSKHPDWTNNQVLRVMLNTIGAPTDGEKRNDSIGYGIVRPRIALKTPGDPGPAGKYPLPDYPVAASKSPSTKPSKGAQAPDDSSSAAPAAASKGDDSNTPLWVGIGVGALVVAGAATAVAVTRSRRRAAASQASPPPYPPAQPPYQGQPYGATQFTSPQPYAPPSGDNRHNPNQGR